MDGGTRMTHARALAAVAVALLVMSSMRPTQLEFRRPLASVMSISDSSFHEIVAPGCGNANAELEGTVDRSDDQLKLQTTKSTRGDEGESRSYVLTKWGSRTYLIEGDRGLDFCNAVNVGEEPDGTPMIGSPSFWKLDGDASRPAPEARSLPSVPAEWEHYLLRKELSGVTRSHAGRSGTFVDVGTNDGVFEGLHLLVRDVPVDAELFGADHVDRVAVVRWTGARSCRIEFRNYSSAVPKDLTVVTGVRFPAGSER